MSVAWLCICVSYMRARCEMSEAYNMSLRRDNQQWNNWILYVYTARRLDYMWQQQHTVLCFMAFFCCLQANKLVITTTKEIFQNREKIATTTGWRRSNVCTRKTPFFLVSLHSWLNRFYLHTSNSVRKTKRWKKIV